MTDTGGVYLVPAFVGLGAPYWDPYARGVIVGLTRGTGLAEIARATIDSMAYQVADLVEAMGGRSRGSASTRSGSTAERRSTMRCSSSRPTCSASRSSGPTVVETTAWGAAALAGLAVGFWGSPAEIAAIRRVDRRFEPAMAPARRTELLRGWHRAVERSRDWARPD